MLQKEELQMEIEAQQELGLGWDDSLVEGDKYPVDVNSEDPENISGERQEYWYWLVTVHAVREASRLRGQSQTNTCRQGT